MRLEASSLQDAIAKAKGCPILGSGGGSVELAETFDMWFPDPALA